MAESAYAHYSDSMTTSIYVNVCVCVCAYIYIYISVVEYKTLFKNHQTKRKKRTAPNYGALHNTIVYN